LRRPLLGLILKRFASLGLLLPLISLIVFVMISLAPGDPVQLILGQNMTPDRAAQLREELGLDRPLLAQWWDYVGDAVQGDFGTSYRSKRPVSQDLFRAAAISLNLAGIAVAVAVVLGMGVGIISAAKRYSLLDNSLRILSLAVVSLPVFWLGLMLISLFAVKLHLLPAFGWQDWRAMILPVITLSTFPFAIITRLTRSSMLEVLGQDYITTARAYGLTERRVVLKHALRNALVPILTIVGLQFGALVGGAILTESVFAIPGLGRLTVTAILGRDYPIVAAAVLLGTALFVLVSLVVDVLYFIVNPRIST
jgi:peptide/nickel transport system permease protein